MKASKWFKKTKTFKNIRTFMDTEFMEVLHTTLNPEGPGTVRAALG